MKNIFIFSLVALSFMACSSSKQNTVAVNEADGTIVQNKNNSNGMEENKDFNLFATGNDPVNWNLETVKDTMVFTSDDGVYVKYIVSKLKKQVSGKRMSYSGKNRDENISIEQTEEICTVPTVRRSFTHRVNIIFRGKTYTGCGLVVSNTDLGNKWMLEKISDRNIAVEDYNRIPVFQFDPATKKVSGNDGCNSIGGDYSATANTITFSAMFSTKMACMKKSIEAIIGLQMSGKTVNYQIKDDKLYLSLPDKTMLVFKRA